MSSPFEKTIYQLLLEQAYKDDVVSEDEQSMISTIMSKLSEYTKILDNENIANNSEKDNKEMRTKILKEALEAAKTDNTVTQDEYYLLNVLRKAFDAKYK